MDCKQGDSRYVSGKTGVSTLTMEEIDDVEKGLIMEGHGTTAPDEKSADRVLLLQPLE